MKHSVPTPSPRVAPLPLRDLRMIPCKPAWHEFRKTQPLDRKCSRKRVANGMRQTVSRPPSSTRSTLRGTVILSERIDQPSQRFLCRESASLHAIPKLPERRWEHMLHSSSVHQRVIDSRLRECADVSGTNSPDQLQHHRCDVHETDARKDTRSHLKASRRGVAEGDQGEDHIQ